MKFKTSKTFLPMSVLPEHEGSYDLRRSEDGTVTPADFVSSKWQVDIAGFDGWRGLEFETTPEGVLRERRALSRYRFAKPATFKRALQAAVRLARYHVAAQRRRKAFGFYLIANRIDPERLHAVDRAWLERHVVRLGAGRPEIEAKVNKFFAKRGAPPLQVHEITATRGT
ncbi:hypothetical protein [Burkholderia territorii]|nr:hypothetical protein [Burkholderia territorii]